MYISDGSTYYFDTSLKDSIKVSSRSFSFLLPGGYGTYPKNLNSFYAVSGSSVYHYYKTKDSYDSEKIASSVSDARLSADGKTLIYQDDDEIVKLPLSGLKAKETTVAENVLSSYYYSFRCDPSLKNIYYVDDDYELRYASKNGKKIASDVDSFFVNDKGLCVFITDDGDLYYSSKGGSKNKITGISDAEYLAFQDGIFYVGTDDDVLYISKDGKKFTKSYEF